MANLEAVIKELRQERDRLDKAIATLTSLNASALQPSGGRTISAAARRRISAAQKARWAKIKTTKSTPGGPRPKRRISAAGIARIRAAAKARWARVKGKKKK